MNTIIRFTYLIVVLLLIILLVVFINSIFDTSLRIFDNSIATLRGVFSMTKKPIYYILLFIIISFCFYFTYKSYSKLIKLRINKWYFLIPIGMILILGSVNIVAGEIQLLGDWKRYFDSGALIANNFNSFDFYNIYHKRALFYTVPIFKILPVTVLSVQIVNLLIHIIAASIFGYVIYNDFGKIIAFRFLLLYAISFEFYSSINIASHDIAFLFYFSILTLLLSKIKKSNSTIESIIIIVLSAAVILIIDFQRGVKLPIVLALAIMAILNLKDRKLWYKSKVSFYYLIVISLVFSVNLMISRLIIKSAEPNKFFGVTNMLYSYNDLNTKGDYRSGQVNRINYIIQLDNQKKQILSLEKYFSQISNYPMGMLILIKSKATNLFSLTPFTLSSFNLTYNIFDKSNYWVVKSFLTAFFLLIKLIWMFLAVKGLAHFILSKSYIICTKLYVLFSALLITLFLFSEVNPSYQLILYPGLLFFSALGSVKNINVGLFKHKTKSNYLEQLVIFGVVCFSFFYLLSKVFLFLTPQQLVDFNKNDYVVCCNKNDENLNVSINSPYELYASRDELNENNLILSLNFSKKVNNYSFFLKTKTIPDLLKLKINGHFIQPERYKLSQYELIDNIEIKENFNDYYYFFSGTLLNPTMTIEIDLTSLNDTFIIRDIMVK